MKIALSTLISKNIISKGVIIPIYKVRFVNFPLMGKGNTNSKVDDHLRTHKVISQSNNFLNFLFSVFEMWCAQGSYTLYTTCDL